ncbi:Yip1 family protein [Halosegnis marinus]|uniref:YIP1 family protein n=1 Tax=Halosegnis marinus TaxID=3034023 RepID=A0ABD5ZTG2_9EURY|nr:Yip1 family protein [Halosegnis sp. DT85]
MLDILFSPDRFFRERAGDPGLGGPVAVVAVVALLGAVAAYPAAEAVAAALPAEAQGFSGITIATTLIGAFVGPFVVWILFAAVFHGLSAFLYDAEGDFRDTLAFTGWGFVPAIVTAVVGIVVGFLVWGSVQFPDATDPQAVQQFTREIRQRPEFIVSGVVGLVVLLWRGMLWTFAMQHCRNIEFREALVTVGVPVGLLFLYRLSGLVL